MSLRADTRDIKDLQNKLTILNMRSIPVAVKFTLNGTAREAMYEGKKGVKRSMTLRAKNNFTRKSIQFRPIRKISKNMYSETGSIANYLKTQEFGGKKKKKGKKGVVLPTTTSSGESKNKRPRKRLPMSTRKLEAIRLRRVRTRTGGRPKNNKQAFILKMIQAQKRGGDQFFYHDFKGQGTKKGKRGIFMTSGGSKSKKGVPKGMKKLRMVFDMTQPNVKIPRNPWLLPASKRAMVKQPQMYKKALEFQVNRLARIGKR